MKKLIIYTILFLSPFIVTLVGMEYLLRKIPNSHMVKAEDFEPKVENTKILIFGNSHASNALDPDLLSKEAYNLSQGAQSLDVDYALFSKYEDRLDSLEYVVVAISYHSFWLKLSDLEYYKWMAKYNNIYFDVHIEKNPLKMFIFMEEPIKKDFTRLKKYYLDKNPIDFNLKNGFMSVPPATDLAKTAKHGASIAKGFTFDDLSYRYDENVKNLEGIINIAKRKKSKIILITVPCYPTYLDNLDMKQLNLMYKTLDKVVDNKDVFYYDFLEDARTYKLEDFANGDHLSYLGAEKVTNKVDSIILKMESLK